MLDKTSRDSSSVGPGGAWESAAQQGPKPLLWEDSSQPGCQMCSPKAKAQLTQGASVGFANSGSLRTLPLLPHPSPQQSHLPLLPLGPLWKMRGLEGT